METQELITEKHINELFVKMKNVFGSRWGYKDDAKQIWFTALQDRNVRQLQLAFSRCISERWEWPPTLSQFREMCLPTAKDLGLPDANKAYYDACNKRWTHGIVYQTALDVGLSFLFDPHRPEKVTKPVFLEAYQKNVDKSLLGFRFEMPVTDNKKLERPKVSNTHVSNHLNQMRSFLT